jgi:hypothetical protein
MHPLTLLILPAYLIPTIEVDLTGTTATLRTSTNCVHWEHVVRITNPNPNAVQIKAVILMMEPCRFFEVHRSH